MVGQTKKLDALRDLALKFINEASQQQKDRYNKGRLHVEFFVGDKVWRKTHVLSDASKHFNAKLAPPFEGPYDVIKKLSPEIHILDMKDNRRTNEAHV